jgi:hypothetical protein
MGFPCLAYMCYKSLNDNVTLIYMKVKMNGKDMVRLKVLGNEF